MGLPQATKARLSASRAGVSMVALVLALAVGGCVGDTDPANQVGATNATLNAHGRTDNGPAYWWWEYAEVKADVGTARGVRVCGTTVGPTARCGPASSSTDVKLAQRIYNLKPLTTYHFRACGQDVNRTQPACARVLSFTTKGGVDRGYVLEDFSECGGNFENFRSGSGWDAAGNTYVACDGAIRVYNASGALTREIALPFKAWDVAPSPDGAFLYVARDLCVKPSLGSQACPGPAPDAGAREAGIKRLNRQANGSYAVDATWAPQRYSLYGILRQPWGRFLATDAAGNLYVADGAFQKQDGVRDEQNTVVKYAPNGSVVTRFGEWDNSWNLGTFYHQLNGVGVSRDGGRVYTVEGGNNRVQYWDRQADGTYRATGYLGSNAVTDPTRSGENHCNDLGWTSGFASPYDVGLDGAGNLFVLNTSCNEVDMFSPAGTFVRAWRVSNPVLAHGIAVARNGDVFVPQVQKKITKVAP